MYAKVIGPNIFRTSGTLRLKLILQPQNVFYRDAPAHARGRARAAASHNHTPQPTHSPRRQRYGAAVQRRV